VIERPIAPGPVGLSAPTPKNAFTFEAPTSSTLAVELSEGDSVAVNGVCLTATDIDGHAGIFHADVINETGRGVIGTPEMAIAQIERLLERSGGFGTYLFQGADFARFEDQKRSYSLFAEEVIPHFDGQLEPVVKSYDRVVGASEDNKNATAAARLAASDQWQRERAQGQGARHQG